MLLFNTKKSTKSGMGAVSLIFPDFVVNFPDFSPTSYNFPRYCCKFSRFFPDFLFLFPMLSDFINQYDLVELHSQLVWGNQICLHDDTIVQRTCFFISIWKFHSSCRGKLMWKNKTSSEYAYAMLILIIVTKFLLSYAFWSE